MPKPKKYPEFSFNYRIIKHKTVLNGETNIWYDIRTVYYDYGKPTSMADCSISAYGSTPEELKKDFNLIAHAFKKPVLDEKKFGC